ncbi:MAG: metalloenzyme domain protein [Clostridia bacterium]|jgi:phosphopentomutase|nr:metalloenzyme domain protein [Clostridia bacterium]
MKRFVVIVLDGLGIRELPDVAEERSQDRGANTLGHILEGYPDMKIPHMTQLGIKKALVYPEQIKEDEAKEAYYSRIQFEHDGADTFYGHQEIMGSKPTKPYRHTLNDYLDEIVGALESNNYNVRLAGDTLKFIVVNEVMTIADNIECDLGLAINVTGALDAVSFEEIKQVGEVVRKQVKVPRVIAFGGSKVTITDILQAAEVKDHYIGINAPKSGVYNNNYHCVHLGYGIDSKKQAPYALAQHGIKTYLLGKVADIVENNYGESFSIVSTQKVLQKTISLLETIEEGFICTNVQETDLAGHAQNTKRYKEVLELADEYIGKIKGMLTDEDILVVTADHGNDPTIGHSKHTREYVPLLVYSPKKIQRGMLEEQFTLANIGASVCDYFHVSHSLYGKSFLNSISKQG